MSEIKNSVVVCVQPLIDAWRDQVMKLHPKKRKNWKGTLTNKYGQNSPVIYKPKEDKFYNKNWGQWCLVQSKRECFQEMEELGDLEYTDMSPFMKGFYLMKDHIEKQFGKLTDCEFDDLSNTWLNMYKDHAQTGNHIPHNMRETHGYGILRR